MRKKRKVWLISGFGPGGAAKLPDADGFLSLPVYHNWDGEAADTLPSHTQANPTVVGVPKNPYHVEPVHPVGWTDCMLGDGSSDTEVAIVDLGGVINPGIPGLRILALARTNLTANANQEWIITDNPTEYYPAAGNIVYYQTQENANPDRLAHRRIIDGVTDFSENYTGGNASTGNQWRYYMFEQLASGNTTWTVRNLDGVLNYTYSRAYQGSAGVFPNNLRYLGTRNLSQSHVCQIWVGKSTDAWPTLPMSPISNL